MKTLAPILFSFLVLVACQKDEVKTENHYTAELSFPDESASHPKKDTYQGIIDKYVNQGLLGVSVMIEDEQGQWLGTGGHADIVSDIKVQPGHSFFIGSISKVFTATSIFHYVDLGQISIDDPVNKWIDAEICDKVDNANESTISDLLTHRSGIKDWYIIALEMARFNKEVNNWTHEDILAYVYDKNADFSVGERYGYSNTNYVLLGMILEQVSGKSLGEVYQDIIFSPLELKSADYIVQKDFENNRVVKGYMDIYGSGVYTESQFLYRDEMGTGDGGISINAQDLGVFMKTLLTGGLISESSTNKMQDWFDLPGNNFHVKNGYGLEYFKTDFGAAYGHTGGVDGFNAVALYYPDKAISAVVLLNFTPSTEKDYNLITDFRKDLEAAALN